MLKPSITIPLGRGGAIVEGRFLSRPNRFLVEALVGDQVVQAHLADRGRLRETLVPDARLLLAHQPGPKRATSYQAVAAYVGERLASIDTALPNRLIEAALRAQAIAPFEGYPMVRREAVVGASRFDFLLEGPSGRCLLEVKSAGLIIAGVALFPDAPTDRGRRHLRELTELVQQGQRCAVLFVAQGNATAVAMHTAIDPRFAEELARAHANGLEVYAYSCPLSPTGIELGQPIPVQMTGSV
jgi:sugar fermentation stimulation protein A